MINRQVAFASGGMLSAFKPVGDGSHDPTTSLDSKSQCSDSNAPSTSSHSNTQSTSSHSTLYYPMATTTASQPWQPAVLIKPHPPTSPVTTATPSKRKATSGKTKVKKKKKQEIDHSGFVPRKIASSSSTVRNPLLATPLASEKKEEKESIKETDDLFSLYDDFDVAAAPPTDHTSCSSSIWDNFEATAVEQQAQPDSSDSEESSDTSSEDEATPTMDHVSQLVTEVNTSVGAESVDEVQDDSGRGSLQQQQKQPNEPQPVAIEESKEHKNERLLRLLGMPMKNFLSAGQQCPLKEHTSVKVTNSGSYLDKPHPSKYCTADNSRTAVDPTLTVVNDDKLSRSNQHSDVKKPDGLSFGLSRKRGTLMQGPLFNKDYS